MNAIIKEREERREKREERREVGIMIKKLNGE